MPQGWSKLRKEGWSHQHGGGFPLRAYSEFMPPPYVGWKPYGEADPFTVPASDDLGWNITESEEALEIAPGLTRVATHLLEQLQKLARGEPTHLSSKLLKANPAWTPDLAAAARAGGREPPVLILSLALSRTQDDKGRVRWTLFGASHEGPARAFWRSFRDAAGRELATGEGTSLLSRLLAWSAGTSGAAAAVDLAAEGFRVLPVGDDPDFPDLDEGIPRFLKPLTIGDEAAPGDARTLLTFRLFDRLPSRVKESYLAGSLRLVPHPASLVFWGHQGYRRLARDLPYAMQVPLLHLFPRSEILEGLRIPQSGWLDEIPDRLQVPGESVPTRNRIRRTHRFQRVERDVEDSGDALLDDPVTVALFSAEPDHLGLYGKPMARNCQVWTEAYARLLDGPRADRAALQAAARACHEGGRFGYRFFYPPMRVGDRSVFYHRPLVARPGEGGKAERFDGLLGYLTAEREGAAVVEFRPRAFTRGVLAEAIALYEKEPGQRRHQTASSVRALVEWRDLVGTPLPPSFARRLVDASKEKSLDAWLTGLPARAADPERGNAVVAGVKELLGPEPAAEGAALTYEATRAREFEERYWRTIAALAHGEFRDKNNADPVRSNAGKSGGPAAAGRAAAAARDLDRLPDYFHRLYREAIERHGMAGRAVVADHLFRWETDFQFPWMEGWRRNEAGEALERNVVLAIPGRNRGEAVVMADHYDTAYMEDLYESGRGGDRMRASALGADDNHSATAALLLAADVLLPLAREGKLARDIWLCHLTGEEFPADCLGARALARSAIEGTLALTGEGGERIDLSKTRIVGVFDLDMVAHNHLRDLDVFQIAPGEGRGSARLAWHTYIANERWNRSVKAWNQAPERKGRGRGRRLENALEPPPIAEHPDLIGEIRLEWDPRSALYNTDGQIFSDLGIPVVLLMENYDIRRAGYHDTHDTLKNIDLDYGAALVAVAIEAVAQVASVEVI